MTRVPFDLDGLENSHVKVNLPETITKQDDEDFLSVSIKPEGKISIETSTAATMELKIEDTTTFSSNISTSTTVPKLLSQNLIDQENKPKALNSSTKSDLGGIDNKIHNEQKLEDNETIITITEVPSKQSVDAPPQNLQQILIEKPLPEVIEETNDQHFTNENLIENETTNSNTISLNEVVTPSIETTTEEISQDYDFSPVHLVQLEKSQLEQKFEDFETVSILNKSNEEDR